MEFLIIVISIMMMSIAVVKHLVFKMIGLMAFAFYAICCYNFVKYWDFRDLGILIGHLVLLGLTLDANVKL